MQPAAQLQGAAVTVTPGQPDTASTSATTPQFLAEIQTTVVTPTVVTPTGQTTPTEQASSVASQKPPAGSQPQTASQVQPAQTQYVTAEIQGSPTQSGNAQSTPQYIVVTVTEGSLHSSDSVSDSSPPPAVVQTGVPTQVSTAAQYYEGQPTSGTQASSPGTSLTVAVTAGTTGGVSMFVAQPTSAAEGGATVVTSGGTANGSEEGAGTNGSAVGSYVIQGGYMLGSGSNSSSSSNGGAAGNSQTYSHSARASPATVSITEGEESSVPSADKKVCRGAKRRSFFSFRSHSHNPSMAHTDDVIVEFCQSERMRII
ncbi:hypothetical protein XENOCAPTIV_027104 [Xenoophorus captivus]|uniref:Uncharacterized protein n=1 Tax=Xenoophorus captivus TaxID=1517983 RepID=A0ABV0R6S9_9TELE